MLRRWVLTLTLCSAWVVAGCGASTTRAGLTADFAEAAKDAHNYQKSHLVPGIGGAHFSETLAASKAKVKVAEAKVANDADEGVWLILTMINVKSYEANGARELEGLVPPSRASREAAEDLTNEREHCMNEAEGWLSGKVLPRVLNEASCLKTARLAASVVMKKK